MELISYAQNLEDIVLWRALRHVQRGRYIDVGAAWPDQDSVTKLFHERGWRGINVEPNPELLAHLETQRPADVNLGCAVGTERGTIVMNIVADSGLSTADDVVGAAIRSRDHLVERIEVPAMTLADIWNEHVPTDGIVHFLKIDVEGFELAVLRGWDHEFHRPWVLVVEATEPGTQHEVHEAWEPLVLGARYHLVYADGINRFYVADERAELDAAFRYPPNVFDGYRVAATMAAEERASQFEVAAKEAEHRTENVVHDLEVALERIGWLSATLDESTARTAQVHRELVEVDAYSKGLLASIDVLATQLATVTSERDSAAARFAEAQQHHAAVIDEASRAHERAAQLDAHIRTMYASTSWKAARPVRLARRVLQRIARLRQRPASSRPVDPSEDPVPGVIEAQALEARPLERESTAESADTIHVLRMLSNATRSSGRGN